MNQGNFVWQDREIIFDAKPTQLDCRRGEVAIDSINSVEDTKGISFFSLFFFFSFSLSFSLLICF